MNIKKHLDLLGYRAKDRVTGFSGVIASISFDLYGCIQAVLTPGVDKDGKIQDGRYFDIPRLEIKRGRVMQPPNYDFGIQAEGRQGAAEKPTPK